MMLLTCVRRREHNDDVTTTKKSAETIRPGDVIVFLGTPHVIATIEPYTHPTEGETVGIAKASNGWGITLFPGQMVEVG